jgi:hypothetical protein
METAGWCHGQPRSPSNLARKGWVAIEAGFDAVRFFPAFPFLPPGGLTAALDASESFLPRLMLFSGEGLNGHRKHFEYPTPSL